MARLYVGGPIPGRKVRPNPETVSGFPRIGTFQGLGMPSTVRQLRLDASKAGVKLGTGGRQKVKALDPDNICHRIRNPELDRLLAARRRAFEQARILSLRLDRLTGAAFDLCATRWGVFVRELIDARDFTRLRELVRLEESRGQVRVRNACKFANLKI